ncbi:DUF2189 domain-containing protein [Roseateles sp. DAIF2]|uniref:DUF2189 domain-containing protein n=1 Tax=Roseateles sp. DAIF2 TaxID=2714952 RepID=UPI0018A32EC2|nr:DUF2189 domain-containing protein [Roseateles sp. DAIF2]QPF74499.1 DUF2189 domain-containing protein [Roseateles sp. DAIF2]
MRRTDQALQESRTFGVRPLPLLRPLGWLARGARDLAACPGPSLTQGLLLALAGAALIALVHQRFWLLAGAFSAFLLVAPVLATGFYALSRALERGEPHPGWTTVRQAWRPRGRLVRFGLLLALAGSGWVLTSAALITTLAPLPIRSPQDFLQHIVLDESGLLLFEAWLGLGALLAAPVFASSVVAIPLLLDREISVLGAVYTSWRVVLEHPAPVALWALLLLSLTLIGMATAMLGLVVILPLLGHASWHAYRDMVRSL